MTTTYILLTDTGAHTGVGRFEQTEADIQSHTEALQRYGFGGWLCRLEGNYYGRRKLTLTMLRELRPGARSYEDAAALFHQQRATFNRASA